MAITLIATPKAADANSYTTRAWADEFIAGARLFNTTWTAATTAQKDAALIWATRLLDLAFDWQGSIRTLEQALRWPRAGALRQDGNQYDYDTVPDLIQEATAELAQALIARDRTVEPDLLGQGFRRASVGELSVDVDPAMVLPLIPPYLVTKLEGSNLGKVKAEAAGSNTRIIKLGRS